jgi:hypothetical protein
MDEHSVRSVPVCKLSSFSAQFTSASCLADLQVSQIHTQIWDLVFCFFSTSGTCHFLGSSLICWSAHKQSSIAQSITEADYVATANYCSQILWIVHTMSDYRVTYKTVPLTCDSSSAICLAQNPIFHGRAKHINVRHHFLRDMYRREIQKWNTLKNKGSWLIFSPNPLMRLGVCRPYGMVWGELVFYLLYTLSYN